MTVEECYGFWRYTTRMYCLYRLLKDEAEGHETASVWFTVLKDYPKEEVYAAFNKAKEEFTNSMPAIPVILDYIRIERKRQQDREEMRKKAEERRRQEELEKDPEYQKKKKENMARVQQMLKEWSDAVTPDYLKNKDK